MVRRDVAGMLLLGSAAACIQLLVILSTLVQVLQLPYYRLAGTANLFVAICIVLVMLLSSRCRPKLLPRDVAWICLRGFFGAAAGVFSYAAVAAGAPIGDSSALGCINIIVASTLGRIFLKEYLSYLHLVAGVLTILGALCITKPMAVFGRYSTTEGEMPMLGFSFAIASGISSGGLFLISRKLQHVSYLVVTCSISAQEGLALWIMALTGFVEEMYFDVIERSYLRSFGLFLGIVLLLSVSVAAISAGSAMCPAAASSVVFMSVCLTLGYAAQRMLHQEVPDMVTAAGAVLMFLAVTIMSFAQAQAKAARSATLMLERDELVKSLSDLECGPVKKEILTETPNSKHDELLDELIEETHSSLDSRVAAFFCTDCLGHLNPMLAIAESLVRDGWHIHFYCPIRVRPAVELVGAYWQHLGHDDLDIYQLARSVINCQLDLATPQEVNSLPFAVVPAAVGLMPYLISSVSELRPYFIMFDAAAPWGHLLAQYLSLPSVSCISALPMPMVERAEHSHCFSVEAQEVLHASTTFIRSTWRLDYDHNHSYTTYAPSTIVASSRIWHKGHKEFPPEKFHYWGPLMPEKRVFLNQEHEHLMSLFSHLPDLGSSRQPLVFCALGTVVTGFSFPKYGVAVSDFYCKLMQAATLMPQIRFVLAVGQSAELLESVLCEGPDDWSPSGEKRVIRAFKHIVPKNVLIVRSADQPTVLKHTTVFVTHCGQNSCNDAIANAVPVLACPFFGDQATNARRFTELGCGLVQSYLRDVRAGLGSFQPDLSLITASSIAESIQRLLAEPDFRSNMQHLQDEQTTECGTTLDEKLKRLLSSIEVQAKDLANTTSNTI